MKITVGNKCPSCGANVKFNPTTQNGIVNIVVIHMK